jgi:hypothetical protein
MTMFAALRDRGDISFHKFRRLVLCCSFTVSLVTPLTHIHVDDRNAQG